MSGNPSGYPGPRLPEVPLIWERSAAGSKLQMELEVDRHCLWQQEHKD